MGREVSRRRTAGARRSSRPAEAPLTRRPIKPDGARAQSPEPIELQLLGRFALRRGARAMRPLPKKGQALLAYLALQRGRPIPREQLADLLWGRSAGEQARKSLRQCLMVVRSALKASGTDALTAEGDSISLATDGYIAVDATRFEALSASKEKDDLEAAVALYRDEFLAGLQVASQPFDEWVLLQRRRLASAMSDALHRLATAREQAGDAESASETAERLTEFDPLREDGHRLLMRALATAGRRSAALKQYDRCVELLKRELGVSAEPATMHLAEQIRAGGSTTNAGDKKEGRVARPQLALPDKPSIAVLPFTNISGDADDRMFTDGMVEDVTMALGRVPWLFVIASSSAFTYRDSTVDVRQVGSELGVRYVLRGSVRRSGRRVRIVVQLTDASRGNHIWADRFDGDLDDVFEMQDRVATQVAATIAPTLHAHEIERVQRKPTENMTAYDRYLRALQCFRVSYDGNLEALRLLKEAIEIDPAYGAAYGLAARCYHLQTVFGWALPTDPCMHEGFRLAHLATEVGKDDSEALWMAGHCLLQVAGEFDYGLGLIERSLSLNPNSASAWVSSCFVHAYIGETERALEDFARAQRLNPRDSMHHVQSHAAAIAHFVAGRYAEAGKADKQALQERPTYPPPLRTAMVTCGLLGELDEAREYARRLLAVNPNATVRRLRVLSEVMYRRHPDTVARIVEGARRAGLPEE
jgi:TolB-like protein/Tfp pilus assembly protein PilF/DNA-binding winged helix-turn-helix (wHTH) protein